MVNLPKTAKKQHRPPSRNQDFPAARYDCEAPVGRPLQPQTTQRQLPPYRNKTSAAAMPKCQATNTFPRPMVHRAAPAPGEGESRRARLAEGRNSSGIIMPSTAATLRRRRRPNNDSTSATKRRRRRQRWRHYAIDYRDGEGGSNDKAIAESSAAETAKEWQRRIDAIFAGALCNKNKRRSDAHRNGGGGNNDKAF